MTRSGGPPEAAAVPNIAGLSNGANPRQRPEQAPQSSEQPARGESEQQRPGRTDQIRREESRTEQLPLDGARPDRQPGPPQPATRMPRPMTPPNRGGQSERSRVRRARLRAVRLDPWSVMKTAFLLSIAFAIVTMVSVIVVWQVLEAAGVYESVNSTIRDVLGSTSTQFNLEDIIGLDKVLGVTALICVINVVLITAVATLCAFLYNLSASLLGGVEVTLAEDE